MVSFAEVVGPMLGARHRFATGVVRREGPHREVEAVRFWQRNGVDWRLEDLTGGPVTRIGADFTVVRVGAHQERGPRQLLDTLLPAQLLMPVHAYIWGRPGEDWRPTGEVTALPWSRVRVELGGVEEPDLRGAATVSLPNGHLEELVLGEVRAFFEELRFDASGPEELEAAFAA